MRMQLPSFPAALDRTLATGKSLGISLIARTRVFSGSAMRALSKLAPQRSPHSLELLAQDDLVMDHSPMGKADLDAVMERRSEIAREVAALEAMRVDMEAEDQELSVAERVLRRLTEATAASRRAEAPAIAASNEG
jgi:hypothetical protein